MSNMFYHVLKGKYTDKQPLHGPPKQQAMVFGTYRSKCLFIYVNDSIRYPPLIHFIPLAKIYIIFKFLKTLHKHTL